MTRSAYATTSALTVACPLCKEPAGKACHAFNGDPRKRCHSARRKAADAARTLETNPRIYSTDDVDILSSEIPPEIPIREYAPERRPDLCPDAHDHETCKDPACECMPF